MRDGPTVPATHPTVAAARRAVQRLRHRPDPPTGPLVPGPRPAVSVVVPTHHRAEHLARCLDALDAQKEAPVEVIVVRGPDDTAAAEVIAARGGRVTELVVTTTKLVDRLHAGAHRACGSVVAFTDDDAAPRPDWIDLLQGHFTDGSIGAVGGRDLQPKRARADADHVGEIGIGGRVVGGHSDVTGPHRDVEHLRGVNMAFRRNLLRLPVGLRGPGAPGYNELAPCLSVLDAGRRVVYDPAVLVDHHLAPRYEHGDGNRLHAATAKRVDDAYNQSYTLLSMRPHRRFSRMAYVVLVGDRSTGGILRCAWAGLRGDQRLARELVPLLGAHIDAWRESQRNPLRTVSPDEAFPSS